jgi:hypothetical protein
MPNTSRATTLVGDIETFDSSCPSVCPGNLVLPRGKALGYLHEVLKVLAGFAYVALRLLLQASYEQGAQMRVSRVPDVVTRVFMLLRGVAPGNLDLWKQAAARATVW